MTRDGPGWASRSTASNADMDGCMVCGKTTRSHVLFVRYDADSDSMVAAEGMDEADGFGVVCHGCYSDVDGYAPKVAALYDEKLNHLLNEIDADKEQLANDPGSIEVPDDFDMNL